ncbi:MAG: hypothetical protein K1X88_25515 [Nannocystaceae bacterium]|nr:hypothetical protein [Nannocystaceae bacterium]
MFLVSGTKRSGTSMWMQAFVAANVEVIGQAFPKRWGDGALREANPDGFYESIYRDGVFFGTNPHPDTGEYVRPEATRDRVVKVFVPGVVRTELGFIGGVVANVRRWRDYEASVARLWALEDRQRATESPDEPAPPRLPGALEWWAENFSLLRDHNQRGYPLVIQTYEQVLAQPERYVRRALAAWCEHSGRSCDVEAAVAAIKPAARTQSVAQSEGVEPRIAQVFDDLYDAIERGITIDGALLRTLVATQRELYPQVTEFKVQRARRMVESGGPPPPAFLLAASMS